MQIKNPLDRAIENVKIFGINYSIDAEGTLENVPEAHARYWQENLHKFLILRKDKLEAPKEVVSEETIEIPTPKVEEVVEATPTIESEPSSVIIETPVEDTVSEEVIEESPVVAEKPKSKGRPKLAK